MERVPDSPFLDTTRKAENTIYEDDLKPLFKILNPEKRDEHIKADVLFTDKQPSAEETKQLFTQHIFCLSIGQSHGLKLYRTFTKSVAAKYFSHIHHIEVTIYFGEPMIYSNGKLEFSVRNSDPFSLGLRRARIQEIAQFLRQCSHLETVTLYLEAEPYERYVASNVQVDGYSAFLSRHWKKVIYPLLIGLSLKNVFVYLRGHQPKESAQEVAKELYILQYWLTEAMCAPRLQDQEAESVNATDKGKASGTTRKKDIGGKGRILQGLRKMSDWSRK